MLGISGIVAAQMSTLVGGRNRLPLPQYKMLTDVRCGSFATWAGFRDVRSASNSDQTADLYSITSSARASNDVGSVMPSALAVVRLMTRSNLVGCSTGI